MFSIFIEKKSSYTWTCTSLHPCCCRVNCTLLVTKDTKVNETWFPSSNCGWEYFLFFLGHQEICFSCFTLMAWHFRQYLFPGVHILFLFSLWENTFWVPDKQFTSTYWGHYLLVYWGILYSEGLHICSSLAIIIIYKVCDNFLAPSCFLLKSTNK